MEIIAVYSVNDMKHIKTLCGEHSELISVKVDGLYSFY
jgi:hypothetical protein